VGGVIDRDREGARFVCSKCGCASDARTEEQAIDYGWHIDSAADPPRYLCPACHERRPAPSP
jgi:predicted RNA-binding Zn-ribbon protein involved in translation (DUF1610 family)